MTGYYNLPKEEQDKYNVEMSQEDLRAFYEKTVHQKLKRENKLIHPLVNEQFTQFLERLTVMLKQLDEQAQQEHMYGPRGPWHVHKRAQNCFICDYSTMINQLVDILIDLSKLPRIKSLAFASTKEGPPRLKTIKHT